MERAWGLDSQVRVRVPAMSIGKLLIPDILFFTNCGGKDGWMDWLVEIFFFFLLGEEITENFDSFLGEL